MKNKRGRLWRILTFLLTFLCAIGHCREPVAVVWADACTELPEECSELPEEEKQEQSETLQPEQHEIAEDPEVAEHTYADMAETLYPYRNGYYDLLVYDGAKWGHYRIYVRVGARIPGSVSYDLYYDMQLIDGEELGITIEPGTYATMYDRADGYPEEVRQYHLPVRFVHEKTGYHFESADISGCYQTYFTGMGDYSCDFTVDTNGCGMTNWGEDGLYHNDIIRVQFVPNSYTIVYDGNGAVSGSMPSQTVSYGAWTELERNSYQKSYSVCWDGMGGTVSPSSDRAVCEFLGWQDRNDFVYQGVDYHWYTIDAPYYANYYRDILQSFGYDKAAIVNHYMEYGVKGMEDRRGSAVFRLKDYISAGGSDLPVIFGSDRAAYVSHWNSYGYNEGRKGCMQTDTDTNGTYPDGAAVRNLTGHVNGTVTLTARWSQGTVTLPTALREGYELLGWSRQAGAQEVDFLPGETVTVAEDSTFYAVWKKEKQFFNVAYIGNGQDGGADFIDYRVDPELEYSLSSNETAGNAHFTRQETVGFVSSRTGEFVEEETTQTVAGWSLQENASGENMYALAMTWKGEELYRQAQTAGNITKSRPAAAYGTSPGGLAGNGESVPADIPDEYVNLYAVWDCGAVIEAYDLYYTLEEAQEGKITQEELLRHASATDREAVNDRNPRGTLRPGVDEEYGTRFIVGDYDAGELQAFRHGGSVTETYLAVDSAGNVTRKQITVYIVDTAAEEAEEETGGRIRFISRKYLDTLPVNSVWVKNPQYRELLEAALLMEKEERGVMIPGALE